MELRSVIVTPDGKQFDTKAEALDYLRRPKILAALKKLSNVTNELAEWLLDQRETVEMAFEAGTIRRVSKSESKRLKDAIEHIKVVLENDKKAAFVVDNADAILETFRWPSVKRMDEAEKAAAARNTLVSVTEGNEALADWIVANKAAILEAFEAGVEKRQVNPKAEAALAAYRAEKAKEKAILDSQGKEALDTYIAERNAAKAAAAADLA